MRSSTSRSRTITALLLSALLLIVSQTVFAQSLPGTVTAASVDLHKDPNLSSEVVGTFSQGTAITLEGRNRDNSLVFIAGGSGPDKYNGWVSAGDVSWEGDINVLPIWDNGQGDENRGEGGENNAPPPASPETNATMRTDREVKVGANECYRTIFNIGAGTPVKILARNADGSWVFIWADGGDGWVPASSVNANFDIGSLPVWNDPFDGESCAEEPPVFDSRICGRPGGATAASTTRWTDIFETADPETTTGRAYEPGTGVTISGRDFWGCWVQVSGAGDSGWVPVNALDEQGVMDLPVLVDNSEGCVINADGSVTCPFDE